MEDTAAYLKTLDDCNGKIGAVGYCLGGKLCYLMCCRTDIDCAVAYYGTYIEHNIREVGNLHQPFVLHMAMKDRKVPPRSTSCWSAGYRPIRWSQFINTRTRIMPLARHGGRTYSKPEADRALALTVDFFHQQLD